MSDWIKRNSGAVFVNLATVVIIGMFGLWLRAAVSAELDCYISDKDWVQRQSEIDRRLEAVEAIVKDGRAERLAFQAQVIDRLARIETEMKRLNGTKP